MAVEGRQRATRLSSGSVKRRVYVEDSEDDSTGEGFGGGAGGSDSEEDFKPEKKVKKKVKGNGHGHGRSRAVRDESPSSDEFQEEDDDEDEDEDEEDQEGELDVVDSDAESEEDTKRKKLTKGRTSAGSKTKQPESHQEVIDIVQAPKGKPPKGTISPHLMKFMKDLKDPAKNDRDWFARHKNVYDYIYQNWLDYVEACTDVMMERVDDTIAWLPPKTLVERIYRDVRFSNDKTPYKKHLSWCLSRNGRKGSFAKYYFCAASGSSGLHAGMYEPSKEDLQTIRSHILDKTELGMTLKNLVKDKEFCRQFGAPPKAGAGKSPKRTSLWGAEDELKRSPKDYAPDHPDINWLKLKHFTVSHNFTDEEVLSPNFMDKLVEVAQAAKPLVEIMNDMLHGAGPTVPADEM